MVWKRRNDIPQPENHQRIRIQADLPKQLCEDVAILYKVMKAASETTEYQTAMVRDYTLVLHDKQYTAKQLETLPLPIRPSSLACKRSSQALAFFSKYCALSNHYPSTFNYQDHTFATMEQYLAFKRAQLSKNNSIMELAVQAKDIVEAKSILNFFRKVHEQEWQEQRAQITLDGLREKFQQNILIRADLQMNRVIKN